MISKIVMHTCRCTPKEDNVFGSKGGSLFMYSSGQNKVPMRSDYTATIEKSLNWISFQLQLYFSFVYTSATIRIGIPLELLPRPISQLNNFPLDFYLFFYLFVVGNSSTEEFKLYNLLSLAGIVYWLYLLCTVYRLLRLLIGFAFGSCLL